VQLIFSLSVNIPQRSHASPSQATLLQFILLIFSLVRTRGYHMTEPYFNILFL
jgi:hypothetical protein